MFRAHLSSVVQTSRRDFWAYCSRAAKSLIFISLLLNGRLFVELNHTLFDLLSVDEVGMIEHVVTPQGLDPVVKSALGV